MVVALALVLGVIRPALKSALAPPPPPPVPEVGGRVDEVVADDPALPGPDGATKRAQLTLPAPPESLEDVRALARQNPAVVANVLRGWVSGQPST
jgi:flagellar M-ring protein FliF